VDPHAVSRLAKRDPIETVTWLADLFDDFEGSVTEVLQLLGIPHPW
jgi:hypothetical protein